MVESKNVNLVGTCLVLAAVPALAMLFAGGILALAAGGFVLWVLRGGTSVVVPWSTADLPALSVFAHRLRTRDGSFLSVRKPGYCVIVLWKRERWPGLAMWIADAVTGFTGVWSAELDCSLEAGGEPWMIVSGAFRFPGFRIDGPQYAPQAASHGCAIARIDISSLIDGRHLLADLQNIIADPAVRHKGAAGAPAYIFGRTRSDRVICSSLIGNAILRQPESVMAQALKQALRERFTYGEITPADLARAAAILHLCPEGVATPVRTVPVLARACLSQRCEVTL
ncbi:MAG TPA: hypothetical protein VG675_07850 [Bryobacteraceae bacterium]|nr:hypothetical protein [Bryobacteraceae bacterium]